MIPLGRYQGQVPMPMPVYRDVWPGLILPPRIHPQRQRYATPTFVASAVGGGSTTCTNSVPTGTAENDLLIWFVTVAYGTRTDPSGWELLDQTSKSATWIRLAPASPPASYSVTVPAASCRSVMHAWRGIDTGDPIMAYRGHVGATSNKKTDPLYFQSCDYIAVAFNGQTANLSPTAPSGWTQAGLQAGSSGGDVGVGGAYLSVTATEGCAASGDWGGNINPAVMVLALRASGQTTLSLKARGLVVVTTANIPPQPNTGTATTSIGVSLSPGRRWGDLEVVVYAAKKTDNGTSFTFGTPTGFTKKETDQIWSQSVVPAYLHMGIGVVYRIIGSGNDGAVSITTNVNVAVLTASAICFSTGSSGSDPSLPGTKGQSNDASYDTTQDVPAMTLEDYAENNILVGSITGDRGDGTTTPPSGWDMLVAWQSGTAGNTQHAWWTKMNSGANPGATTATRSINQYDVAVQFAVGVVLDGAGYSRRGYIIG